MPEVKGQSPTAAVIKAEEAVDSRRGRERVRNDWERGSMLPKRLQAVQGEARNVFNSAAGGHV
jgi:hypothetical protein